jgi:hypothetical protein
MRLRPLCRRAAVLVAAFFAAAFAFAAEPTESLRISGQVSQGASASTPLSGALAFSGGTASSLSLSLEANRASASLRASAHIAVLAGDEASRYWASALAYPARALLVLSAPAFDPSAAAPGTMSVLSLDELSLRWDSGPFAFEAGKTYANWGLGKAFSPADFFAEFDYSAGTPARLSRLIARATWFPSASSRIDLVCDPFAAAGSTAAARAYATAFDSLALSVAGGYRGAAGTEPEKILGALEATFDLPFLSPYGEAAATMALDGSGAFSYSLLAGGTTRIGDATFLGEYLFSPDASPRHSVYALAGLKLDDWVSLSIPVLCYPETGSLTAGLAFAAADLAGLDCSLGASASRSALGAWSGKLALAALFDF